MKYPRQSFSFLKKCLLIISLAFILCGCTDEPNLSFVGDTFKADGLVLSSLTQEAVTESDKSLVYWAESGEVWHKKSDCSSLSRTKNIISGTPKEAIDNGMVRACQRCS